MASEDLTVRINGVSSHVDSGAANTSLSVLYNGFHLLVDAGKGVEESIKKGGGGASSGKYLPDAILITHARRHHISDLPALTRENAKVYCTSECSQQIAQELPSLTTTTTSSSASSALFSSINPGTPFDVGPFSVVPIAADNSGDEPGRPGSVIYIIKAGARKIVSGWDFLKLQTPDESILWNPDLLVLGTETYNEHPSTGMISISEAYNIVRRWNAKECYIVHYRGLRDFEDAKNQWFRGPTKAMNSEELQKTIDENLRVTGKEGKYKIIVAKEGMVWTARKGEDEGEGEKQDQQQSSQVSSPIGMVLEIESLQDYVLTFEKETKDGNMLKLIIEDRINRYDLRFINPQLDKSNDNILYAQGEKGMFATGAEVSMEILPAESLEKKENSIVRIHVFKKKKTVFKDDIMISRRDTDRLRRYIRENF